jgi:hypothetical protein
MENGYCTMKLSSQNIGNHLQQTYSISGQQDVADWPDNGFILGKLNFLQFPQTCLLGIHWHIIQLYS